MLEVGMTFTATVKVNNSNTARAMGSGDLDVFATPALVALMERAAALLAAEGLAAQEAAAENSGTTPPVAGKLQPQSTTVGAAIEISHLRPTAVGGTVAAKAELTVVEGRRLLFRVEASDGGGLVGEGTHLRYVVDRDQFMKKLHNV